MSDEILVAEIKKLEKENSKIRKDNRIFGGFLFLSSISLILTASFQLWYGLAATVLVSLFILHILANADKPQPTRTGLLFVEYDYGDRYSVKEMLSDGSSVKIAKGYWSNAEACHQLNWINSQRRNNNVRT